MTTTTTYTFDTGLSAGTPLVAYIDPQNHLLGTTNTGSTFYAGTPTPQPLIGTNTSPAGAVVPGLTTTAGVGGAGSTSPAGAGSSWLQGDFGIGGTNIPKIAIYGAAAGLVALLLIR